MTSKLTWSGVTARRMARHALTEPATDLGPADIARVLCGAHAQVFSAAEFSIGRRLAGATRTDVQRAVWVDRTLVKTVGMLIVIGSALVPWALLLLLGWLAWRGLRPHVRRWRMPVEPPAEAAIPG